MIPPAFVNIVPILATIAVLVLKLVHTADVKIHRLLMMEPEQKCVFGVCHSLSEA